MVTLGVIADTHIPDRRTGIDRCALDIFRQAEVEAILHAGDVSVERVLAELERIAPVHAVRGNRDWISLGHLPLRRILTFERVRIGMVHGHGTVLEYLYDKVDFVIHGLDEQRYKLRALATFPGVDIVVFGHLHIPVNEWVGNQLLLNPGSACCPDIGRFRSAVSLIHINGPGDIQAEIIPLDQV